MAWPDLDQRPLPPEDSTPLTFEQARTIFAEELRIHLLQLTNTCIYFCLYTHGDGNAEA